MDYLNILWLVLAVLVSFLSGSINYPLLIGKFSTGKDLRNYNIGNPGGFNAIMTYGIKLGMIILFIEFMKGFIPIVLVDYIFQLPHFINDSPLWHSLAVILCPLMCILGHNHSPFLKFKGGRGVGVFVGTLFWVNPLILIIFFIPFGIMIGLLKFPTRVSNIIAVIFFAPAAMFLTFHPPWNWIYTDFNWIIELFEGRVILLMIPFFIVFGMWLAWLPRHIPSIIDAIKGKEWTLHINEGQKFSEKFETKKERIE